MLEINQIAAIGIFIFSYALIVSGKVNRPVAAIIGAVLIVGTGIIDRNNVLSFINWESLGLLAGMFIIVVALKEAGFFRWVGLHMAKTIDHHPIIMFIALPSVTAVMSSFLDAVSVILIMATMTIEILDALEINPIPFVMAEIFAANIGGSATMMTDPPNVIIGTTLGFSFIDFIQNVAPISYATLAILFIAMFIIFRTYLNEGLRKHPVHKHKLTHDPNDAIVDWRLLKVGLIALGLVITLLVIQKMIGISVATAAIIPASIVLAFDWKGSVGVLKKVDWGILVFFGGLFVIVGGLSNTGVLNIAALGLVGLTGNNLMIAITLILWLTAILSTFIDNVALVTALVPVIAGISALADVGLQPLAWALAIGACFGGLVTPFGTATNIAGLSVCRKMNHTVIWGYFFRISLPVTIIALVSANLLLIIRYVLIA
ncbi:MAG: SLC13 family permease [Candidatus Bathyarchaeota archaeon]